MTGHQGKAFFEAIILKVRKTFCPYGVSLPKVEPQRGDAVSRA